MEHISLILCNKMYARVAQYCTRQGNEPGKSCQGTIPWILTVQSKFLKGLVFE